MEELIEILLKGFIHTMGLLVRFLLFLAWDLLIEIVAWYVGWPICRLFTFGRYPEDKINAFDEASTQSQIIVCIVGFSFLLGLSAAIIHYPL